MIDTDELRPHMRRMLEEWKVHVFYQRMKLTEYNQRRAALDEFMRRLGSSPVRPTGWVTLRKKLRERDPDLKVPEELRPHVYRGKY